MNLLKEFLNDFWRNWRIFEVILQDFLEWICEILEGLSNYFSKENSEIMTWYIFSEETLEEFRKTYQEVFLKTSQNFLLFGGISGGIRWSSHNIVENYCTWENNNVCEFTCKKKLYLTFFYESFVDFFLGFLPQLLF